MRQWQFDLSFIVAAVLMGLAIAHYYGGGILSLVGAPDSLLAYMVVGALLVLFICAGVSGFSASIGAREPDTQRLTTAHVTLIVLCAVALLPAIRVI